MSVPETLVMKFGGTSVGSPAAMRQVVIIISETRREWPRLVVVTSALSGVTDLLLFCAASAARRETSLVQAAMKELIGQHHNLVDEVVLQPVRRESVKQEINILLAKFDNLCQAISAVGHATPRVLDSAAGLGERLAVRILSTAINSSGVDACFVEATDLIVTDDHFQNARLDMGATQRRACRVLLPLLNQGCIPVVTGFIGATPAGIQTTLGRGGSDYSAAILAATLHAAETWIWTDVDGVMTADPRLIPEARTIPQLSYREVEEMASHGAKVLHPKTIQPVVDAGSTLRVCNTFNPTFPGTRMVDQVSPNDRGRIKAITALRGLKQVTFSGYVPGRSDFLQNRFDDEAASGIDIQKIIESPADAAVCFALPQDGWDSLGNHSGESEYADLITVLCPGLRGVPATAERIFSILGDANISLYASAYGASDLSLNLFVPARDTRKALSVLHGLIQ